MEDRKIVELFWNRSEYAIAELSENTEVYAGRWRIESSGTAGMWRNV